MIGAGKNRWQARRKPSNRFRTQQWQQLWLSHSSHSRGRRRNALPNRQRRGCSTRRAVESTSPTTAPHAASAAGMSPASLVHGASAGSLNTVTALCIRQVADASMRPGRRNSSKLARLSQQGSKQGHSVARSESLRGRVVVEEATVAMVAEATVATVALRDVGRVMLHTHSGRSGVPKTDTEISGRMKGTGHICTCARHTCTHAYVRTHAQRREDTENIESRRRIRHTCTAHNPTLWVP